MGENSIIEPPDYQKSNKRKKVTNILKDSKKKFKIHGE
jgi:hypothetical protein